ncbi:DUF4397 domain-containing protein [Edaphobacter acidisoli]|nr:DUF4397 domain-containing protein [Edaphobacter acidisoli]
MAILATLTGCQAMVGNPSTAQVRVVDASPDAPSIDLYQDSDGIAYNLGFGAISSYVPTVPGTYTISAATAGTHQVLSFVKPTLAAAGQYTILIGDTAGNLQQLTLKDQNQPAPAGETSLRFLDEATRSGPVDVYLVPSGHALVTVNPLLTNVSFGANTGYQNIPSGTYSLVVLPVGANPASTAAASYTGAKVTYPGTAARTLIFIDQPLASMPGIQVITADDYDNPA